MFEKLISKKTKVQVLEQEYKKLPEALYKLSKVNRMQSDQKMAEAHTKLYEIEWLGKPKSLIPLTSRLN